MNRLILFDIDGTLLDAGGAGKKAMNRVFEELFSKSEAFSGVGMAGKTDLQIVRESLSLHGLPTGDGVMPAIISRYLDYLEVEIRKCRKHVKPGVKELLEGVQSMEGCWLGLLTGNIQEGAKIKLGSLGLYDYFPFGAFGDDHEDRNRLLPIAIEKFNQLTSVAVGYGDCIVIGDTPRDVECSKVHGALSIAVSTGTYSFSDLKKTNADYVLKDLTEAAEVIVKCVGSKNQDPGKRI